MSVGVVVTAADKDAYELAFPGPALGMGCPAVDHDDDASTPAQLICTGYELNQDLDFNTDTFTDNDDGAVIDSSDAYWNGGLGWEPIRFYGTFEGNRYTISNLFINRPDRDEVGLFSRLGFPYTWRNQIYRVGLENVQVTGGERVGALAGEATRSSMTATPAAACPAPESSAGCSASSLWAASSCRATPTPTCSARWWTAATPAAWWPGPVRTR